MKSKRLSPRLSPTYLAMGITGVGVGILVGLSSSPVLQGVLVGVTGSAVAIIAGLSSVEKLGQDPIELALRRYSVNPWPLTILVVGLVIGAVGGTYVRTHNWLGGPVATVEDTATIEWTELKNTVDQWAQVLGVKPEEVALVIFENQYPSAVSDAALATSAVVGTANLGVLFGSGRTDVCEDLLISVEDVEGLRRKLRSHPIAQLRVLAQIDDDEVLVTVVKDIVCVHEERQ